MSHTVYKVSILSHKMLNVCVWRLFSSSQLLTFFLVVIPHKKEQDVLFLFILTTQGDYFHNLSNSDWILPAEYCHLFFYLLTKVSLHFSTSHFLSSCIIFFFQLIIILFLSVKERSLMKIISGKEHKYISRFSKAKKSPDHRHLLKFANHSASYNILNSHPYLTLGVIFLLTSMCSAKITAT